MPASGDRNTSQTIKEKTVRKREYKCTCLIVCDFEELFDKVEIFKKIKNVQS